MGNKITPSNQTPNASASRKSSQDRRIVGGLFPDLGSATNAVKDLKAVGFSEEEIGLAMRDRTARGKLIGETGTKAGEEAIKGVVGGGVLGGMAGLLIALDVLAIPGVGPIIASGALVSALGLTGGVLATGAGIGAAAGGFIGGLIGLDIPETEARHFDAGVRSGHVLVIVRAGSRAEEALGILERHGGSMGTDQASPQPPETTLL
jgi:hypothetical protein